MSNGPDRAFAAPSNKVLRATVDGLASYAHVMPDSSEAPPTPRRWSELSNAIELERIETIVDILSADPGAVERLDGSGLTPLGVAVDLIADSELQTGNSSCLELAAMLLDAGADPDQQSQLGKTARQLAVQYGHSRLVELIDRYGPSR